MDVVGVEAALAPLERPRAHAAPPSKYASSDEGGQCPRRAAFRAPSPPNPVNVWGVIGIDRSRTRAIPLTPQTFTRRLHLQVSAGTLTRTVPDLSEREAADRAATGARSAVRISS